MNRGRKDEPDLSVTPLEMRRIIERAEFLSSGEDRISIHDLRSIAADLGIDSASFEKALSEIVEAEPTREGWLRRASAWLGRHRRVLLGIAAGSLLGAASGLLGLAERVVLQGTEIVLSGTAWVDVPVAIALAALSLLSLLRHRRDRNLSAFGAEALALWMSFFFGWALVRAGAPTDLVAFYLGGLGTSFVVGYLFLRPRPVGPAGPQSPGGDIPPAPAGEAPKDGEDQAGLEFVGLRQLLELYPTAAAAT